MLYGPNEELPDQNVDPPHNWDDGESDEERQEARETAGDEDYHATRN